MPVRVSICTVTNVSASPNSGELLGINKDRALFLMFNDSIYPLYIKYGSPVSLTDFSVRIPPTFYFESPRPVYEGPIFGIWEGSSGSLRLTEFTL